MHSRYESGLSVCGWAPVAGVDEAGRGSCAGPLTAAACILPHDDVPELAGLNDSKQLTPRRREELYEVICAVAVSWSVAHIPAADVDHMGVGPANYLAMVRAVEGLEVPARFVLADGFRPAGITVRCVGCIGGDAHVASIAAASVLAKVSRDRIMVELDARYPGYGFAEHKGYGTKKHMDAVRRLGGSPEHRYSYSNVAAAHSEYTGK